MRAVVPFDIVSHSDCDEMKIGLRLWEPLLPLPHSRLASPILRLRSHRSAKALLEVSN